MRLHGLAAIVFGALGCDALVGGVCAAGYALENDTCVAVPPQDPGEGVAGEGGTGAAQVGSGGDPAPTGGTGGGDCPPPLAICAGACVDLDEDPNHCGACGSSCDTGICHDGLCADDPVGHAVVVGMSLEASTPASRRILGNALFLPLSDPLLFLDYRQYARVEATSSADAAIAEQAALRQRSYQRFTVENPLQLASELATGNFHLVLIHDQALATSPAMGTAGALLAAPLADFAHAGGVIVVLASDDGAAMPSFLTASGILATTAMTSLDGGLLINVAPTDAITIGVPSPFLAATHTSAFSLAEPPSPTLVTVVTGDDAPVVVHRAYVP